jgi:hypothetical protein
MDPTFGLASRIGIAQVSRTELSRCVHSVDDAEWLKIQMRRSVQARESASKERNNQMVLNL